MRNNECTHAKQFVYIFSFSLFISVFDHFFKVQLQLYCTKRGYCDFVVWTNKSLTMERIFPDADFMDRMLPKAKEFVFRGILPELVGRFYSCTEPSVVNTGRR